MIPIAVFSSGRGSNFEAIYSAIKKKELNAEIVAVVCDRKDAPVLKIAAELGLKTFLIPFPSPTPESGSLGMPLEIRRRQHEEAVLKALCQLQLQPRFLVMAGYRRILTSHLIESFRCERGYSRIVNVHPSLLPAFPGINAYSQAYFYGVQMTGATVHLVEVEVDSGPICAQRAFSIADCRSEQEVEERGLQIEHLLFPETLKWVLAEEFKVESRLGGRICVRKD